MFLGLNLSHDTSAAVASSTGLLKAAVSEERLSRRKHDTCFPRRAVDWVLAQADDRVGAVVVGSHSNFRHVGFYWPDWLFEEDRPPGFNGTHGHHFPPGFIENSDLIPDPMGERRKEHLSKKLIDSLRPLLSAHDQPEDPQILFVNHHDAHAATAMVGSNFSEGLVVSLDGSGDGECGVVQWFHREDGIYAVSNLARFPDSQSLGYLYSAVTDRYNFKHTSHEGKITGLAAYGQMGPAYTFLKRNVKVIGGTPHINVPKSRWGREARVAWRKLHKKSRLAATFSQLADLAASQSTAYADLAWAMQEVLEESVVDIVEYWMNHLRGSAKVCLAGGIFANVRVNMRVAEIPGVKDVFIFPDMGDAGLAAGGIWSHLIRSGLPVNSESFSPPYLGPAYGHDGLQGAGRVLDAYAVANDLNDGLVIGVFQGKMEYGPRALLHRSIVSRATDRNINTTLNHRLRRTEFMPFAPVVRDERFHEVFQNPISSGSVVPFRYMTMTCPVRSVWREQIPAVVHVDGSARPQILKEEDSPFMYEVLRAYEEISGNPVLINTSFNAHEEPIIATPQQALAALDAGVIDGLVLEDRYVVR